ncbi:MAG: hypothetical protein IPL06_18520 [Betaproteobacteria bacterium]|nr:hypothetical protein [Betaproteobacteria bacterium]
MSDCTNSSLFPVGSWNSFSRRNGQSRQAVSATDSSAAPEGEGQAGSWRSVTQHAVRCRAIRARAGAARAPACVRWQTDADPPDPALSIPSHASANTAPTPDAPLLPLPGAMQDNTCLRKTTNTTFRPPNPRTLLAIAVASLALAGCASTPAPTEQMAVSKSAIANAASAGGGEYASIEMRSAQA